MVIAVFWLWGCFDHQVDMIRKQLGHSSRKGLKGATRGSISSTLYTGRDVTKVSGSINPFLRCLLYWYSGEIACDLFAFDYLMHTENSGEETNSSFDTDGQTLTDSFQSVQRVVFQTGGEWLFQPISKIPYIYTLYCQLAFVPLLWMESRDSLKLPGNWAVYHGLGRCGTHGFSLSHGFSSSFSLVFGSTFSAFLLGGLKLGTAPENLKPYSTNLPLPRTVDLMAIEVSSPVCKNQLQTIQLSSLLSGSVSISKNSPRKH